MMSRNGKKSLLWILVLSLLISGSGSVFGDALRLSGGQILEGKIVAESDSVIVIRTAQGDFSIEKKDILEVDRGKGSDKIVRIPADPVSPRRAALMSFIPGYSGLYQWSHPEAGTPFSMLNLYYFTKFFFFQTTSVPVSFAQSEFAGQWIMAGKGQAITTLYNLEVGMKSFTGSVFYDQGYTGDPNVPTLAYILIEKSIYERNKEVKVQGEKMSREYYEWKKRQFLTNYVVTSAISAALSYYAIHRSASGGALSFLPFFSSGSSSVAFYALPTMDRGVQAGLVVGF